MDKELDLNKINFVTFDDKSKCWKVKIFDNEKDYHVCLDSNKNEIIDHYTLISNKLYHKIEEKFKFSLK